MDHPGIYGADITIGTLYVHKDPQHRSYNLGTLPHCHDDAGSLGGLSSDSLSVHDVHAHRPTADSPGDMVSRDLRVQPSLPQPRPSLRRP